MDNHNLPLNFQLNNKYRIKKVLGQGGFGITYLAEDSLLDIDVCIKELFISGNSTRGANMTVLTQNLKEFSFADFKDRFLQEAKQLARFGHPNIVRVMEFFEANNTAYVVMEYIAGKNLKDYIAENGIMTEQQALPIIHQLFDAVEEVHNAGMLHRDLKPDNILLTAKNRVVLIDFGSAREFTEGKTITQTAMLTPGFAPIEQYSNRAKRGTFTDIYALGATMYYMLTGHKPIAATDRYREQIAAPHQLNPQISTQLSSAVMMAMEMKEEDRFQSVGDFRDAAVMIETMIKNINLDKTKETNNKVIGGKVDMDEIKATPQSKTSKILTIILSVLVFPLSILGLPIYFIVKNYKKDEDQTVYFLNKISLIFLLSSITLSFICYFFFDLIFIEYFYFIRGWHEYSINDNLLDPVFAIIIYLTFLAFYLVIINFLLLKSSRTNLRSFLMLLFSILSIVINISFLVIQNEGQRNVLYDLEIGSKGSIEKIKILDKNIELWFVTENRINNLYTKKMAVYSMRNENRKDILPWRLPTIDELEQLYKLYSLSDTLNFNDKYLSSGNEVFGFNTGQRYPLEYKQAYKVLFVRELPENIIKEKK